MAALDNIATLLSTIVINTESVSLLRLSCLTLSLISVHLGNGISLGNRLSIRRMEVDSVSFKLTIVLF